MIRSQMLYPLSYERGCLDSLRHSQQRCVTRSEEWLMKAMR